MRVLPFTGISVRRLEDLDFLLQGCVCVCVRVCPPMCVFKLQSLIHHQTTPQSVHCFKKKKNFISFRLRGHTFK